MIIRITSMMNDERFRLKIEELAQKNQCRTLRELANKKGMYVDFQGKTFLNLSSNDYLGLAFKQELLHEFYASLEMENVSIDRFGLGASSSRLLSGNTTLYGQVEQRLGNLYQAAALIVNSGYHANIGVLPAICNKKDLILSDKLNHASIVDGLRLCDATIIRYKHLDYGQIDAILEKRRDEFDQVFIVTESIFSMDGDMVDLHTLVDLKRKYNLVLYVDEAHAFGTRGENGLGLAEEQAVISEIDFIVGTFGKALASQGAFIICSALLRNYLINTMRSLIFTTGLPSISLNWLDFLLARLPCYAAERKNLSAVSLFMKNSLSAIGFHSESESNILPIILGENKRAEMLATALQDSGFLLFPVRPPTVPEGTARLRLSLTADMTPSLLQPIIDYLKCSQWAKI